jgi:hypothetical protein
MNGIGLIGEPLLYYDKETLSLVDLDDWYTMQLPFAERVHMIADCLFSDTSDYGSSSVQLPPVEKH